MEQKHLLRDSRFWPIFWTQFFGALNDNFLKNALVVLIAFHSVELMGLNSKMLVAAASAIFIFPFFILSPLAGQICDRFEKSKIAQITKFVEIFIMLISSVGFFTESYPTLLFALFLMGIHSTFFGPLKYSIIPKLVDKHRLTEGNAYVEMGTFISILIGTIMGGVAVSSEYRNIIISSGLMLFALIGLATSLKIPKVSISSPDLQLRYNPIPSLKESWDVVAKNRTVFNTILGISWFWFFGAGVLSVLPVYCQEFLRANEHVVTLFLACFTIGIGLGSLLSHKLSPGRVELGLVPLGSLGISVFLIDLFLVHPDWAMTGTPIGIGDLLSHFTGRRLIFDFFMMSLFGGLFTVPLYTLVQERSPTAFLSRIIASNNILNAIFMVISSLLLMWFYSIHLTLPQIFLCYALLNAVVAIYVYSLVPEFTLRFYTLILTRLLYRLRVTGFENIPKEGPAILACNHVSFVDWLLIAAACPRPVRFIMYYKFYNIPILGRIMKQGQVIPIAGKSENAQLLEESFARIAAELRAGEIVCVFPEGGITRDGELRPLKPGILKMLATVPVPVVPMSLNGMWGSLFSRKDSDWKKKRPRNLWQEVELRIGAPIPASQMKIALLEERLKTLAK